MFILQWIYENYQYGKLIRNGFAVFLQLKNILYIQIIDFCFERDGILKLSKTFILRYMHYDDLASKHVLKSF